MSKNFVVHGGILLLPPCQIARYRVVVNLWAKRNGGLDFSKPPLGYVERAHKINLPGNGFFLSTSGGAGCRCLLDKKKPITTRV